MSAQASAQGGSPVRRLRRRWLRPCRELGLVDPAPFLWGFRALRCRWMEWREGVGR